MTMIKPRTLVALRTHTWNEDVEYVARKLFGESLQCDFVLVVDETNSIIDNKCFEKISHNNDMTALGLPHWPSSYNNLHYNGDYVLYFLRKERPDYDYYVMSENDTLVNFSVDEMIDYCSAGNIDLVAQVDEINSATHEEFHFNSTQWYASFGRAFFPFICASGRLIDSLYSDRIRIRELTQDESKWPYCESYVASHALSNEEFRICQLSKFANTNKYTFMKHKYVHDGNLYQKNSICHPVVGSEFYKRYLQSCSIDDIFKPSSDLRSGLQFLAREKNLNFVPFIEDIVKEQKDVEKLYRFYNTAVENGWMNHIPEVSKAFSCRANQSSVYEPLRLDSTRKNAELLIDGIISRETKSQTAVELNPWVEVELSEVCEVRSILIYVRPFNFHIFKDFYISFSVDGCVYETMYRKNDGCIPDSADLKPITIHFARGNFAKFVRVTLLDRESLALNQIEIYTY